MKVEAEVDGTTVEWIDMDDHIKGEILASLDDHDGTEDAKRRFVAKAFDVKVEDNETALEAWFRYLHALNGLAYSQPAHPDVAHAVLCCGASRFCFFLA